MLYRMAYSGHCEHSHPFHFLLGKTIFQNCISKTTLKKEKFKKLIDDFVYCYKLSHYELVVYHLSKGLLLR